MLSSTSIYIPPSFLSSMMIPAPNLPQAKHSPEARAGIIEVGVHRQAREERIRKVGLEVGTWWLTVNLYLP
jgi:hypothetical protein